MSLLDFLRKTADGGCSDIAPWLKRKHQEHVLDKAYAHHALQGRRDTRAKFGRDLRAARLADPAKPPLVEFVRHFMQADGAERRP